LKSPRAREEGNDEVTDGWAELTEEGLKERLRSERRKFVVEVLFMGERAKLKS